jgi:hypothetical protein
MELPGRLISNIFSTLDTSYNDMLTSDDYEIKTNSSVDLPILQ